MSKAIDLNKENFDAEVINSDKPVLVDFWASWCMPCKMMAPTIDELAEEMSEKIKVVKINTEEEQNQELASKYTVQSIPNLKLFKEGKVIAEFIGMKNKDSLKKEIEEHLS
jgi:thioredoxin 1